MVGYNKLIKNSENISKEQVLAANSEKVSDELEGNFLSPIIYAVLALHVPHSQETTETEAGKTQAINLLRMAMMETAGHNQETEQSSPHTPSSSDTHKRKISQTSLQSFPDSSTETTPTKLLQQEADVQELQDTFVKVVLKALWPAGLIRMPWIRGRVMRMRYVTYIYSTSATH